MPSASVTIAATVNPGARARIRAATRRSLKADSTVSNALTRLGSTPAITTLLFGAGTSVQATPHVRDILTPKPGSRLEKLSAELRTWLDLPMMRAFYRSRKITADSIGPATWL
jgi:hypothetical protein